MANYYESSRSNYFIVKDIEAFKAELNGFGLEVVSKEIEDIVFVALLADEENGFPSEVFDPETFDSYEINWADIFKRHLADEQVAIIMGAGAEKLRYIIGWAEAFNNKGESRAISLDAIYNLAKELGSEITRAEY